MRIRHTTESGKNKIELQMTPMIDIVFQLLVFFIMTFKVVAFEGDFNIKMPLSNRAEGNPMDPDFLPIKIRLTASADGRLAGLYINDESKPPNSLRSEIIDRVGTDVGPGSMREQQEVELECAPNLKYEHVIWAITQVSGKVENGQVVKLIEKIKFAPPDLEE